MGYRGKRNYAYERTLAKQSLVKEGWYLDSRDRDYAKRVSDAYDNAEKRLRECSRPAEQVAAIRRLESDQKRAEEERCRAAWRENHPQEAILLDAIRSAELNFHGGISYRVNALDTLKMVSASSIFGEPQYYRDGALTQATMLDELSLEEELSARLNLNLLDPFRGMTTARVMERVIDEALDADFGATLDWAVELRERYQMRLNPQVIMVRAAAHHGRAAWTREHPGEFARIAERVMVRGDDVTHQLQYWLAGHGGKRGIQAILKRAWAKHVGDMDAYAMAKYGNAGVGLVDVVRICHAKGPLVDTLMREGCVPMPEGQSTWERLRASGMG